MQLRLSLVFKHLFSPSLLEQVQFQNFNYVLDSPFYSTDKDRKQTLDKLVGSIDVVFDPGYPQEPVIESSGPHFPCHQ